MSGEEIDLAASLGEPVEIGAWKGRYIIDEMTLRIVAGADPACALEVRMRGLISDRPRAQTSITLYHRPTIAALYAAWLAWLRGEDDQPPTVRL